LVITAWNKREKKVIIKIKRNAGCSDAILDITGEKLYQTGRFIL
jgi:hypothetical protein